MPEPSIINNVQIENIVEEEKKVEEVEYVMPKFKAEEMEIVFPNICQSLHIGCNNYE